MGSNRAQANDDMESDEDIVCLDQPTEATETDRMRGGFRAKIPLKPSEVIKFFRVTPKRLGYVETSAADCLS